MQPFLTWTPCYVDSAFVNLQHQHFPMGDVQAALLWLLVFRMCALPLVPVMLLQADRALTLLLCSSALSRSLSTRHYVVVTTQGCPGFQIYSSPDFTLFYLQVWKCVLKACRELQEWTWEQEGDMGTWVLKVISPRRQNREWFYCWNVALVGSNLLQVSHFVTWGYSGYRGLWCWSATAPVCNENRWAS